MTPFRAISALLCAAITFGIIGCTQSGTGPQGLKKIKAGGSTFVGPIMEEWAVQYRKAKGVTVDYTLGGSGKGIASMAAREYDFGCTDAFMSEKEMSEAKDGKVLHLPITIGALVPAYNLKVDGQVKFTGPILADIYLGKITKWNDGALTALNPDLALPDEKIVVVRRSEPSGSTFIWTNYLSKVSPEWKEKVGSAKEVKWPTGDGAKGTDGVASLISTTPGALGYVEVFYAVKNKINFGTVRNRKGKDVPGDKVEAVTAAAKNAEKEINDQLTFMLTDADGEDSYPICGAVWAVFYQDQPADKAQALKDFFTWVIHDGQAYSKDLNYAPLPENLVQRDEKKLAEIKTK